jgi:hypothetical protein
MDKILQGAFAGPPTPLKDIPKRNGDHREPGEVGAVSEYPPHPSGVSLAVEMGWY